VAYWLLNDIKIIDFGWPWRSLTTSAVSYPNDSWASCYSTVRITLSFCSCGNKRVNPFVEHRKKYALRPNKMSWPPQFLLASIPYLPRTFARKAESVVISCACRLFQGRRRRAGSPGVRIHPSRHQGDPWDLRKSELFGMSEGRWWGSGSESTTI